MTSTQRSVTLLPTVPGAKVVGDKECATCHAEVAAKFVSATHARLFVEGVEKELAVGCESCHGAGSAHVKAGGGPGTILNPHKNPDTCFQCHIDKRGQFSLPNSHPVLAGRVSCSDCHDPHAGNAIMGVSAASLETETETCTKCHTAQKGPFVFPHNAMKEGCTSCHNPHGSVNAKMLVARDANLCVKCHLEPSTAVGQIWIGGRDHRGFMNNGNCWVAGCHEAVHGSNANKALRY